MSNGTIIASACSLRASPTDSYPPPRSLATCVSSWSPVRLANTEGLRTWLRQAFPANLSAARGNVSRKTTLETCGLPLPPCFARFDHATSSWRTSQGSLLADTSETSSPNWPRWGMWVDGAAYVLPTLELHTSAIDGGPLPTPTATDWKRTPIKRSYAMRPFTQGAPDDLAKWALRESGLDHGRLEPSLWEHTMGWPIGWTDLKPLETDKFREWSQQHGLS